MEATATTVQNLGLQVRDEEEALSSAIRRLCDSSEAKLEKLDFSLSALVEGYFSVEVIIVSAKGERMKRYFDFTRARIVLLDKVFQLPSGSRDAINRVRMAYGKSCEPSDIMNAVEEHLRKFLRGMRGEALAKRFFENIALEGGMVRAVRFATHEEDMRGIDLWVTVKVNGHTSDVPLQVKTDPYFQIRHRLKHFGTGVPSILFYPKKPRLKVLRAKVFSLLEQYASHGKVLHVYP